MLFSQSTVVFALAAAVAAAPVEKRWGWPSWGSSSRPWGSSPASSPYLDFGKRYPSASSNAPVCDLSQASMPSSTLPAPADGLSPYVVAVGRGVQNYTCDLSNATAVPKSIGALASLFNVSCIAANQPDLLAKLPEIALNLPVPDTTSDPSSPAAVDLVGHHYFIDDFTTPFFNLDTASHSYGMGAFKVVGNMKAPSSAMVGQYNKGDGAVAWLKLDAKSQDAQVFQEVYRLNTAGGLAPKMCTGMPSEFSVEYAAEYWFWS